MIAARTVSVGLSIPCQPAHQLRQPSWTAVQLRVGGFWLIGSLPNAAGDTVGEIFGMLLAFVVPQSIQPGLTRCEILCLMHLRLIFEGRMRATATSMFMHR